MEKLFVSFMELKKIKKLEFWRNILDYIDGIFIYSMSTD